MRLQIGSNAPANEHIQLSGFSFCTELWKDLIINEQNLTASVGCQRHLDQNI